MARTNKPILIQESIQDRKARRRKARAKMGKPIPEGKKYEHCGGHMIDPPSICKYKKQAPDGAIWVDTSLCIKTCKIKNQCDRWNEYGNMSIHERIDDFRSRGVNMNFTWY